MTRRLLLYFSVPPRPVRRLHASVDFGTDLDLNGFTARPRTTVWIDLVTVRLGLATIIIEFIRQVTIVRPRTIPTQRNSPADVQRQYARRARQRVHQTPDAFSAFCARCFINMFWSSVNFRLHAFVFISARRCQQTLRCVRDRDGAHAAVWRCVCIPPDAGSGNQ